MEDFLLAAHVLAGILFVGPVAVATSMFARFAPVGGQADAELGARPNVAVALVLHRITRVYGLLALVVPVVGLVLAAIQGRLTEIWVVIAMVLTAVAGALLALRVVPSQRDVLGAPDDGARLRALRVTTGIFNLIWAAVVVLMIVRPGSAS